MKIHFVYPHGSSISCPDAIGREVGKRLSQKYDLVHYDWAGFQAITPGDSDILLGHACPIPFTTFRRSCRAKGWKRVVLMSPYCHGDDYQPAFNDHVMPYCDLYLAITGNFWFKRIGQSGFSHWQPKMRHLDLAVDRSQFPPLKKTFNPPGRRTYVYIGRDAWYKNVPYLSELAQLMGTPIAWIGSGGEFPGLNKLGRLDFSSAEGRRIVAQFDFLLTVGKADGNPTTILEAMAWGLIPICTPESGYDGYKSIANIPLGNAAKAVKILNAFQTAPEDELIRMQRLNWQLLDEHFNWDRMTKEIISALEDHSRPRLNRVSFTRQLAMRWAEMRSPYWADYLDPSKAVTRLRKFVFHR